MPEPSNLLVVLIPGFTAGVMAARDLTLRSLLRLAPHYCLVQIEPVQAPTQGAQEATYLSGLMPEFHGQVATFERTPALPPLEMAFWTRAARRHQELPTSVIESDALRECVRNHSGLVLFKLAGSDALGAGSTFGLDDSFSELARDALKLGWVVCLLGVPTGFNQAGRGLMLGLGFEHQKTLIGACEVAGILDRVLTGVELGDKV